MHSIGALFRLLRPHQWVKNCFVFAGLLFVNPKTEIYFTNAVFCFAAFCAAASSIYIINDVADLESDREHPVKCSRPIASSEVSIQEAFIIQIALTILAGAIAWEVGRRAFGIVMLYLALSIAYSFWLKRVVLLDVFAISMGFMLRIAMGTMAIGIPASHWLLLTGFMLTLFIAFCKRQADPTSSWDEPVYIVTLDQCTVITAAATILCYALFTVSPETAVYHHTDLLFITVPFVAYGILRYVMIVGHDASSLIFTDIHLAMSAVGWLAVTVFLCWS